MNTQIIIKKNPTSRAFATVKRQLEGGTSINGIIKLGTTGRSSLVYAYLDAYMAETCIGYVDGLSEIPDDYTITLKSVDNSGAKPCIVAEMITNQEEAAVSANENSDSYEPFDEEIKRIVGNGIEKEENVKAIIDGARGYCCVPDPVLVAALKRFWTRPCKNWRLPAIWYTNTLSSNEETYMTTAIIACLVGTGLVLQGPKSVGKNVFFETLASILHLPRARINFMRDMLLEDVFGAKSTDNSAAEQMTLEGAKALLKVQVYQAASNTQISSVGDVVAMLAEDGKVAWEPMSPEEATAVAITRDPAHIEANKKVTAFKETDSARQSYEQELHHCQEMVEALDRTLNSMKNLADPRYGVLLLQKDLYLSRANSLKERLAMKPTEEEFQLAAEQSYYRDLASSVRITRNNSAIIEWARHGGALLFDELNMADPNLLQQVLNPLTDTDRVLLVPGEEEIPLHPDCIVLGGMNPGYAGTCELNEATASRMGVLDFAYPGSIAGALLANFPNPDDRIKKLVNTCNSFFNRCVALVQQGAISDRVLSVRGFVHALQAYLRVPKGLTTLQHQLRVYVLNGCEADEKDKINEVLVQTVPVKGVD